MYHLLSILILFMMGPATQVSFKTLDASGAPLKNELVIVQDLNGGTREVLRALSDASGEIQSLELKPGLYRLIATDPYGLWQTKVTEFLINAQPAKITVSVDPLPTHGRGDVVTLGERSIEVQVLSSDGQAAVKAKILSRDELASLVSEKWYLTNQNGRASVSLVGDPTMLIVWFGDVLVEKEIHPNDSSVVIHLPKS